MKTNSATTPRDVRVARVVHVHDAVPGAAYIGGAVRRSHLTSSPFGNPFPAADFGRSQAIERYYQYIRQRLAVDPALVESFIALRGRPLSCWCRRDGEPRHPENLCHGDVLVDLLERCSDAELRAWAAAPAASRPNGWGI
jgi:hypothetical protein